MNKDIRCPVCGTDGCSATYYDWVINRTVTDFNCDADLKHHFLIVELPPTEFEELSELKPTKKDTARCLGC